MEIYAATLLWKAPCGVGPTFEKPVYFELRFVMKIIVRSLKIVSADTAGPSVYLLSLGKIFKKQYSSIVNPNGKKPCSLLFSLALVGQPQ